MTTRRLLVATLTAAALGSFGPLSSAGFATAGACDRPATTEVCRQIPRTQWICYHVHDPHFDFCIPPLPRARRSDAVPRIPSPPHPLTVPHRQEPT